MQKDLIKLSIERRLKICFDSRHPYEFLAYNMEGVQRVKLHYYHKTFSVPTVYSLKKHTKKYQANETY